MLETDAAAREVALAPLIGYLLQSIHLLKLQFTELADEDIPDEDIASLAAERFIDQASLIGGVQTCHNMCLKILANGISEIACLVDFGVEPAQTLRGLHYANQLKDTFARRPSMKVVALHRQLLATPFRPKRKHVPNRKDVKLVKVEVNNDAGCLMVTVSFGSDDEFGCQRPQKIIPGEHIVLIYPSTSENYVFASPWEINNEAGTLTLSLRMGEWPPIMPLLPTLAIGTRLQLDGGHGDTVLPPASEMDRFTHVLFVGAGTGIAGLWCVMKELLKNCDHTPQITLVYSWNVGNFATPLFISELAKLASSGRIKMICTFTGTDEQSRIQWDRVAAESGEAITVHFKRVNTQVLLLSLSLCPIHSACWDRCWNHHSLTTIQTRHWHCCVAHLRWLQMCWCS